MPFQRRWGHILLFAGGGGGCTPSLPNSCQKSPPLYTRRIRIKCFSSGGHIMVFFGGVSRAVPPQLKNYCKKYPHPAAGKSFYIYPITCVTKNLLKWKISQPCYIFREIKIYINEKSRNLSRVCSRYSNKAVYIYRGIKIYLNEKSRNLSHVCR